MKKQVSKTDKKSLASAIITKAFNTTPVVASCNVKDARSIVNLAKTNHGFISIHKYRAKNGNIANYLVQPLSATGYISKIEQALEFAVNVTKPIQFDQDTWDIALNQQIASWSKTLRGEQHKVNKFTKIDKGLYDHEDNDFVYIRNVVLVNYEAVDVKPKKHVNSAQKTLAKQWLVKNSPLSTYGVSFTLEQGNFETVSFNKLVIEG
jgi:hypothetical protein